MSPLESRIDSFFSDQVVTLCSRLQHLSDAIPADAWPRRDEVYDSLCEALSEAIEGCRKLEEEIGDDHTLLDQTRKRFYEATAPWFHQSWIGHRALTKPRGYPGDYLLLGTIYNQVPKSRGLGGYIDLYIMDLLLAKSVRSRWQMARNFLIDEISRRHGDVQVLNVACGPCREYSAGIQHGNGALVHVTCLDNDQEALDFVSGQVAVEAEGIQDIRCQRYNALRMKNSKATVKNFGASDIIYSIGLCDYISDEYMIEMLRGWKDSLSENGVLFVAFKDTRRYDHIPYQWLLDWHFLLRTEEHCRRLFAEAGYDPESLEMERDGTGVIISFVYHVQPVKRIRLDAAEGLKRPARDAAKVKEV